MDAASFSLSVSPELSFLTSPASWLRRTRQESTQNQGLLSRLSAANTSSSSSRNSKGEGEGVGEVDERRMEEQLIRDENLIEMFAE